jgi:hypothetical protein
MRLAIGMCMRTGSVILSEAKNLAAKVAKQDSSSGLKPLLRMTSKNLAFDGINE